jgi:hypothetical protein
MAVWTPEEATMSSISRPVTLALFVVLAGGCATAANSEWMSNEAPLAPYNRQTTVVVENYNWADMVLYAVRQSTRIRLGMVSSMNSRRFDVPSGVNVGSGPIELLAEAIGSADRYLTGPMTVNEGQRVQLRIENQLPISTWSIW